MSKKIIIKSGKRKTAIARAVLKEGSGKVKINNKMLDLYSPEIYKMRMLEPLILADDVAHKVDINVIVRGGGMMGQADAARVAIAKSLSEFSPKLKNVFLNYDRLLLVADIRRKETHKPNTHGHARQKKQKSYR